MFRYAVIHIPKDNAVTELNFAKSWGYVGLDIKDGPPKALFTTDERVVPLLLKDLSKKFPGEVFGSIIVSDVAMCPPGDTVFYTVSEKGMLPK